MENVVYDEKPQLSSPIFIEGLPGVGNVGKIAADYLKEKLNAKRFASIYSRHFPPQVTLDEDCVASLSNNELWYANANGKDVIFLLGDNQGVTPEGHFDLAGTVIAILLEMKVSRIFTLGGYGTGLMTDTTPRVLGAVSGIHLKPDLEKFGVVFSQGEPGAGIVGASGLLVGMGRIAGIDSACLMGETSGYFLDHKSASTLLNILVKILDIDIDMSDLDEKSKHFEELTEKVHEYEERQKEKLGYIG